MADALNNAAPASTSAPSAPSVSSTPTGGMGAASQAISAPSAYTQPTAFRDGAKVSMAEVEAAAKKAAGVPTGKPEQQTLPLEPNTQNIGSQAAVAQADGTATVTEAPFYQKYGGFPSQEAWEKGFQAAAADYQNQKARAAAYETKVAQMEAYIAQQQALAQQQMQAPQAQPQGQQPDSRYLPLESRVSKHFGIGEDVFLNMVKSENRATQAQALDMINEYQTLSNPKIAEFIEKRAGEIVSKALQPFQAQLGSVHQTAAQYQAETEQKNFLAGAQPMLNAVYKELPDLQSNPALNAAFAQAIDEEWESVRFCLSKGINPFKRIGQSIAYQNQATLESAKAQAAQTRLQQTGGILSATPRVGLADTNTKPANSYEQAVRSAAKLGAPQDVVDQFWKAMNRHSHF